MPTPLPITDRPIRLAVVGLGQIAELVLPTYLERDDVEIVGSATVTKRSSRAGAPVVPDAARHDVARRAAHRSTPTWSTCSCPRPRTPTSWSRCSTPGTTCRCRSPSPATSEGAERMLAASQAAGATLRVLEDYLFYPPLVKMRDVIAAGEIGTPVSVHMKIVATGRGGWELPERSCGGSSNRRSTAAG